MRKSVGQKRALEALQEERGETLRACARDIAKAVEDLLSCGVKTHAERYEALENAIGDLSADLDEWATRFDDLESEL